MFLNHGWFFCWTHNVTCSFKTQFMDTYMNWWIPGDKKKILNGKFTYHYTRHPQIHAWLRQDNDKNISNVDVSVFNGIWLILYTCFKVTRKGDHTHIFSGHKNGTGVRIRCGFDLGVNLKTQWNWSLKEGTQSSMQLNEDYDAKKEK